MTNPHILIVEDEQNLAKLLQDYLIKENMRTTIIDDGNEVLAFVKSAQPDVILLDIMLPNKDGMAICKEIRQLSETPIIMTTARIDEIDRIIGLEIGADDYVCKPYSPREVVARVKVQLRRTHNKANPVSNDIKLNDDFLTISMGEVSIEMTFVEYNLLKKLHNNNGRIYNRDQLMDSIYNDGRVVSDRTIDSHIKKIRKKLKTLNPNREYIHSIYGCGYKYEVKS